MRGRSNKVNQGGFVAGEIKTLRKSGWDKKMIFRSGLYELIAKQHPVILRVDHIVQFHLNRDPTSPKRSFVCRKGLLAAIIT